MLEGIILGLHLMSHHAPDKGQNNVNLGVYFETKEGWTGGVYENSFKRMSLHFGHMFYAPIPEKYGQVGVKVGVVTGYKKKVINNIWVEGFSKHEITPAGAFFYKLTPVKLMVIPKIKDRPSTYHVGVEHEF